MNRAGYRAVLAAAAGYYQREFARHSQAQAYVSKRGYTPESTARFGFGWANASPSLLARELKVSEKTLLECGLVKQGEYGLLSYFYNRIVMPIRDTVGAVVAFGGRKIDDRPGPKYLNSPGTTFYQKGEHLYGIDKFIDSDPKRLLLVEGYFDVVALAQSGLPDAVAGLGTALTESQALQLVERQVDIVMCYDADRPGQQALRRNLETLLDVGASATRTYIMTLPDGDDPDSWIQREGVTPVIEAIEAAPNIVEWLSRQLAQLPHEVDIETRAHLGERLLNWIERIQDSSARGRILDELATYTGLSPGCLRAWLSQHPRASRPAP